MRSSWAACALVLAGCATMAPPEPPVPALASVPPSFELSARVSVREDQRGDIVRMRWSHRPGTDTWVIASILGNELARIDSDAGSARLRGADGTAEVAANFSDLTQRLLGAALEPRELAQWLHGGTPRSSGGWSVQVEETQRAGTVDLAKRVTATRGGVVVKFVVDEYRRLED